MSCEETRLTSDLRTEAQSYRRDAAHKHKWAHGAICKTGRDEGHPRPRRVEETLAYETRNMAKLCERKFETYRQDISIRKRGLVQSAIAADYDPGLSSDGDESVDEPLDVGVMYSFDAASSPSQGGELLHTALARAVDRFEARETARLVNDEYDVLGSDGESVGLAPTKQKGRRAAGRRPAVASSSAVVHTVDAEDDDYEFL